MTEDTYTEVVAQVDFEFSSHPDERKRRRQNRLDTKPRKKKRC